MDPVDQFPLVIGLAEINLQSVPACMFPANPFHVHERRTTVCLRVAGTEQIQIRPVENVNDVGHGGRTTEGGRQRTDDRKSSVGSLPWSVVCPPLSGQQISFPQRAVLTLPLRAGSPTAPMTTSEGN